MSKKKAATKRNRGVINRYVKLLDQWFTWASTDKKKHGEGAAILRFVQAHQKPWKERGDEYLNHLLALSTLYWDATRESPPPSFEELVKLVTADKNHLHDLRTGILNYDSMREALRRLHQVKWWDWIMGKKAILRGTGATDAFIGAVPSDAGAARAALQLADHKLSEVLRQLDETDRREAVLAIHQVIHAARAALKATRPKKLICCLPGNPETLPHKEKMNGLLAPIRRSVARSVAPRSSQLP